MMHYFDIPLAAWTDTFIDWLVLHFSGFFDRISSHLGFVLDSVESFFVNAPGELITLLIVLLAWRLAGRGMALFSLVALLFMGALDLWQELMETLALVLTSTFVAVLIAIPVGIWAAMSDRVQTIVRPILDLMQTMPSFVYLIPVLMLFNIGPVPALLATLVFAMPPAIRLTNLGIRQVPESVVEASRAFGSTRAQTLFKVQLPIAMPTIMAGVNQTLMLALSMAVISAMIGAGGLGSTVFFAISRVQPGVGLEGGLGIVILAIILDRISQGIGKRNGVSENSRL